MTFQAGLLITEVHFKNLKKFEPKDESEALRMEHFYLPIGMWVVGILLSLFCFLAEFIFYRRENSKNKTDVPMATQNSKH